MSIAIPNVPFAEGVPPVARNLLAPSEGQALIASSRTAQASTANDWGIFDQGGVRVLNPDSVASVERGVEYRVSDYPLEKGGFQSYNKVATPFEIRLTMTKTGSVADRQKFLNDLDQIQASLDLYDVATPEHVYVGVNVTRVAQARTTQTGANMVIAEVLLQEIRQTVSVAYTTATSSAPPPLASSSPNPAPKPTTTFAPKTVKSPNAVIPVNRGAVQTKAATVSGFKLIKTQSGRQLFVFDKPPGK